MLKLKPMGILYNKGAVVNHRSFIKIFIRPLLMLFGFEIGSLFENNMFQKYMIKKGKPYFNIFKNYYLHLFTCNDFDRVERKNMI